MNVDDRRFTIWLMCSIQPSIVDKLVTGFKARGLWPYDSDVFIDS